MIQNMKQGLAIFLHQARYDRVYQAVNLVLTASAMGWPSHLFLFFDALAAYMADEWDDVNIHSTVPPAVPGPPASAAPRSKSDWLFRMHRNFELANIPSLYDLLDKAKNESGGLTVCACSTSVRMLDLKVDAVKQRVDEIVGLSTMLQISGKASHVLYI